MRHEMSLRGGIFNGAVNLFDDKLQDVLFTLVRQGLCEGEVTLKVSIDLARKEIIDEDGMPHDVDQPYFACWPAAALSLQPRPVLPDPSRCLPAYG